MTTQQMPVLRPEDLVNRSVRELRQILTTYNGIWHDHDGKAVLIERICEISSMIQPQEDTDSKASEAKKEVKPIEPQKPLEHADILDAVKANIEAGLLIKFDETTWSMRFRDRTDSGTLKMPVQAIKLCADMMVRPGAVPPSPKCRSCQQPTSWVDGTGYVCTNPSCNKHVKPANPPLPERSPLSISRMA